jgi:hypothetical protein
MSEQVSDQTTNGSANGGNQETIKDTVAYDTHRKLLGEKKQVAAALAEAQARLEALEQDKLSSEGKKDELITKLQKATQEKEEKLKKVVGAFQYRAVSNKFVEKAKAEGCIKPDKLMALADLSSVEVDVENDFAVSEESVTTIIENLKKEVPFFFQKGTVNILDKTPNNNIETKQESSADKIAKMSTSDLMQLARALDKGK